VYSNKNPNPNTLTLTVISDPSVLTLAGIGEGALQLRPHRSRKL
jgi:hypothetical protein